RHTRSTRDWSSDVCSSDLVVLEPKPGKPTDPNDVRATIDVFTDISGLFVINNESGWYEAWLIHDLRVPGVALARSDESAQFGTEIGRASCRERGKCELVCG